MHETHSQATIDLMCKQSVRVVDSKIGALRHVAKIDRTYLTLASHCFFSFNLYCSDATLIWKCSATTRACPANFQRGVRVEQCRNIFEDGNSSARIHPNGADIVRRAGHIETIELPWNGFTNPSFGPSNAFNRIVWDSGMRLPNDGHLRNDTGARQRR